MDGFEMIRRMFRPTQTTGKNGTTYFGGYEKAAKKFSEGFLSTYDPYSYAAIPGALNYARKHPGDAAQQAWQGMQTPEGLGALTSSMMLPSFGAGMAGRAGAGSRVSSAAARAPKDMIAEAIARERSLQGTMKSVAANTKVRTTPKLPVEQTLRNATRRMGFYRPDDPRLAGKLNLDQSNIFPDWSVGGYSATQAYHNPEGFFFDMPKRAGQQDAFDNLDEYDPADDLAYQQAEKMGMALQNAQLDQQFQPLHNADRFFKRAFGSNVISDPSMANVWANNPALSRIVNDRYTPEMPAARNRVGLQKILSVPQGATRKFYPNPKRDPRRYG